MSDTMKAVLVNSDQSLVLSDIEKPVPGEGKVGIRVSAAGVNRADILQRKGKYPPPAGCADVMGLEVAGHIEAVGAGVKGFEIGQRVCALLPSAGYAEYAVAHAGSVMSIPKGVSFAVPQASERQLFKWQRQLVRPSMSLQGKMKSVRSVLSLGLMQLSIIGRRTLKIP